jgi:nitrite reductase/ring-hydroxylating ferredoxin subunit
VNDVRLERTNESDGGLENRGALGLCSAALACPSFFSTDGGPTALRGVVAKDHSDVRVLPLTDLPPCAGGAPSRRNFCAAIAAGAGMLAVGLPACGSGGGETGTMPMPQPDLAPDPTGGCAPGLFNAGAVSAIPVGTAKLFSAAKLFVCRDAQGLYAMSAECTHEGATLRQSGNHIYCPRHGATFDLNGDNPTSPAFTSLDHYALCLDNGGEAMVDSSSVVSSTTRTSG